MDFITERSIDFIKRQTGALFFLFVSYQCAPLAISATGSAQGGPA